MDLTRKCLFPSGSLSPAGAAAKEAMAGGLATELLFLDTFKHQSAEVVLFTLSILCCVFSHKANDFNIYFVYIGV